MSPSLSLLLFANMNQAEAPAEVVDQMMQSEKESRQKTSEHQRKTLKLLHKLIGEKLGDLTKASE